MTEKDIADVMDAEETIETFEFTDDEGQEHCFVVESKFKVGKEEYVALLEVDPNIFAEEEEECGCEHEHEHVRQHAHGEACDCGHDHAEEDDEPNIILAKIVTDANGEVDLEELTDEEFEKAVKVYESLEA